MLMHGMGILRSRLGFSGGHKWHMFPQCVVTHRPAAQVRWWRCCNPKCGHVEPAHTTIASGPGDVLHQADKLWQQGAMLYQVG